MDSLERLGGFCAASRPRPKGALINEIRPFTAKCRAVPCRFGCTERCGSPFEKRDHQVRYGYYIVPLVTRSSFSPLRAVRQPLIRPLPWTITEADRLKKIDWIGELILTTGASRSVHESEKQVPDPAGWQPTHSASSHLVAEDTRTRRADIEGACAKCVSVANELISVGAYRTTDGVWHFFRPTVSSTFDGVDSRYSVIPARGETIDLDAVSAGKKSCSAIAETAEFKEARRKAEEAEAAKRLSRTFVVDGSRTVRFARVTDPAVLNRIKAGGWHVPLDVGFDILPTGAEVLAVLNENGEKVKADLRHAKFGAGYLVTIASTGAYGVIPLEDCDAATPKTAKPLGSQVAWVGGPQLADVPTRPDSIRDFQILGAGVRYGRLLLGFSPFDLGLHKAITGTLLTTPFTMATTTLPVGTVMRPYVGGPGDTLRAGTNIPGVGPAYLCFIVGRPLAATGDPRFTPTDGGLLARLSHFESIFDYFRLETGVKLNACNRGMAETVVVKTYRL